MEHLKRAVVGSIANRHAIDLTRRLGMSLRDARKQRGLTQAQAATRAGLAQTTWSKLERMGNTGYTIETWDRAAHAVGTALNAYLPTATAADAPRDSVHLRNQELVLRTAQSGAWRGVAEDSLDTDLRRSRHGDVVLERPSRALSVHEWCLVEVVDWTDDVGQSVRDFDRRLAALDRLAVARMRGEGVPPKASGLWLLRATMNNRRLVTDHRLFFRGRFPASSSAWLTSLTSPDAAMPLEAGLLWVDVRGTRIFTVRLAE
jgi:transcriptional regulator with XRE-family HTH domain